MSEPREGKGVELHVLPPDAYPFWIPDLEPEPPLVWRLAMLAVSLVFALGLAAIWHAWL